LTCPIEITQNPTINQDQLQTAEVLRISEVEKSVGAETGGQSRACQRCADSTSTPLVERSAVTISFGYQPQVYRSCGIVRKGADLFGKRCLHKGWNQR
jgi:hypothetical protein